MNRKDRLPAVNEVDWKKLETFVFMRNFISLSFLLLYVDMYLLYKLYTQIGIYRQTPTFLNLVVPLNPEGGKIYINIVAI